MIYLLFVLIYSTVFSVLQNKLFGESVT